jgi:hypothetical protein
LELKAIRAVISPLCISIDVGLLGTILRITLPQPLVRINGASVEIDGVSAELVTFAGMTLAIEDYALYRF